MKYSQFRETFLEFVNRPSESFGDINKGTDRVIKLANMAKAWAQRRRKFEAARATVTLEVASTGFTTFDDAVREGTEESVRIRNVERVLVPTTDSAGLYPIEIITRTQQVERVRRKVEDIAPEDRASDLWSNQSTYFQAVLNGRNIGIWPWPSDTFTGSSVQVTMDVIEFLPEYTKNDSEDFFIVECVDWMLMRCVYYANMTVKEDERIVLSHKMMDEAWQTVEMWDASLVEGVAPIDLD